MGGQEHSKCILQKSMSDRKRNAATDRRKVTPTSWPGSQSSQTGTGTGTGTGDARPLTPFILTKTKLVLRSGVLGRQGLEVASLVALTCLDPGLARDPDLSMWMADFGYAGCYGVLRSTPCGYSVRTTPTTLYLYGLLPALSDKFTRRDCTRTNSHERLHVS